MLRRILSDLSLYTIKFIGIICLACLETKVYFHTRLDKRSSKMRDKKTSDSVNHNKLLASFRKTELHEITKRNLLECIQSLHEPVNCAVAIY